MILESLDELLIEIQNIKNITSIEIRNGILNEYKSSMLEVIPVISVIYDGNKCITLSSKEKYFDILVKKVTQVYNREKDNVLEDDKTDPFKFRRKIKISDHDKEILNSGILLDKNKLYEFYNGKYSYDKSLLFQKDEVKSLLNIVEYHLYKLFDKTDIVVKLKDDFRGFKDTYSITATINGIDKDILIMYEKLNDNEYIFTIHGILNGFDNVIMNIKFDIDNISVITKIPCMDLVSTVNYDLNNKSVKEYLEKGYLCIYTNETNLEASIEEIKSFDNNLPCNWYKLPFGALYGIYEDKKQLSDTEQMIETYVSYLNQNEESFLRKDNYSKSYFRNSTTALKSKKVVLDQMLRDTHGIKLFDDTYLIETSFLDTKDSNGYYEGYLKDRYFYHLFEGKITQIDSTNIRSINSKDIYDKADLLNKTKVMKLIKGEN